MFWERTSQGIIEDIRVIQGLVGRPGWRKRLVKWTEHGASLTYFFPSIERAYGLAPKWNFVHPHEVIKQSERARVRRGEREGEREGQQVWRVGARADHSHSTLDSPCLFRYLRRFVL